MFIIGGLFYSLWVSVPTFSESSLSMSINPEVGLTPTETLVLELLIARFRLGERLWTFDSNVRKQVESLGSKGYVHELNGIVPMTVRARLTDEAVAMYLSYDYVPPIAKGNPELTEVFKAVTAEAVELKQKFEERASGSAEVNR